MAAVAAADKGFYDYKVEKVVKFGDGDSFWVVFSKDVGFYISAEALVHVRVLYVDTPERGQLNYKEASVFTHDWLVAHMDNLRGTSVERDEFGRWLSVIYDAVSGETLAQALKDANLLKPGSKWNTQ